MAHSVKSDVGCLTLPADNGVSLLLKRDVLVVVGTRRQLIVYSLQRTNPSWCR